MTLHTPDAAAAAHRATDPIDACVDHAHRPAGVADPEGTDDLLAQLPGQVALVAADGSILAVNNGWRRFASANGLASDRSADFNYLHVCAAARGPEEALAGAALVGIRDVLRGSQAEFELQYPCHSPDRQSWFRLRATPVRWRGAAAALVMHTDVSAEVLAGDRVATAAKHLCDAEQVGQFGTFRVRLGDDSTLELSAGLRTLLGLQGSAGTVSTWSELRALGVERLLDDLRREIGASGAFHGSIVHAHGTGSRQLEVHAHQISTPGLGAIVLGVVRDVTGLQLALQAQAQSRAVLRMAGTSIGSWSYERPAGFVISPGIARALKLRADSALGSAQVIRRIGSHHRELVLGAFRAALLEGKPFEVEAQFQAGRRAQPVWLRIGGEVLAGTGLQGALQIIDDRKRIEQALAESQRTLELLSRCHDVLTRATDESRLLHDICAVVVGTGNYPAAWIADRGPQHGALRELSGAGLPAGLLTPDFLAWPGGAVRAALRGGRLQFVPSVRTNSRYARWAAHYVERGIEGLLAVPLADGDEVHGALVLYLGHAGSLSQRELEALAALGRDIGHGIGALRAVTMRRQIASELARSRDLLESAQAIARLGSVEIDHAQAGVTSTAGTERILGLSQPPRAVDDLLRSLAPASRAALLAWLQPSRQQEPFDLELQVLEGPAVRWVRAVRGPACAPATRSSTIVFQDITEIRQARDEVLRLNADLERKVRRRTRQLETANRDLEAFSYSVSHDLKTPLAAIDGFTHVLASRLKTRLDDKEAGYLDRVRAGVASMYGLIDAMLALHSATHGRPLLRRPVDLSLIAEELLAGLREQEPQRPCAIRVEPGIRAQCDQELMTAVLRNLLGNAWKFSARKPVTSIEVAREPGTRPGLTFRVTDEGAGFAQELAANLFTPFRRLHHSSEFPGTGIGLATVQRIVRRHGGTVWAEGRPGIGATVWINLPDGEGPLPDSGVPD